MKAIVITRHGGPEVLELRSVPDPAFGLCLDVPPGLTWEEAAAVPETFLTAFDALFIQGSLKPGETVLLHAAGRAVPLAEVTQAHALMERNANFGKIVLTMS